MTGWAQRPLAVCTIRGTYRNKAGTESPAVGGIYLESSGAPAKLWSALVLCLPAPFLPATDRPANTAVCRGWPRFPGNGGSPDSDMQLCAGNGSRLSCYAFIISFTMKYLLTNCEQGLALLMEGAAWENKSWRLRTSLLFNPNKEKLHWEEKFINPSHLFYEFI